MKKDYANEVRPGGRENKANSKPFLSAVERANFENRRAKLVYDRGHFFDLLDDLGRICG